MIFTNTGPASPGLIQFGIISRETCQPLLAFSFSQVVRTFSLTCPHSLAATSQFTIWRDVPADAPLATVYVAIES